MLENNATETMNETTQCHFFCAHIIFIISILVKTKDAFSTETTRCERIECMFVQCANAEIEWHSSEASRAFHLERSCSLITNHLIVNWSIFFAFRQSQVINMKNVENMHCLLWFRFDYIRTNYDNKNKSKTNKTKYVIDRKKNSVCCACNCRCVNRTIVIWSECITFCYANHCIIGLNETIRATWTIGELSETVCRTLGLSVGK